LAIEAYRVVDGKEEAVRGLILEHLDLRTLKDIVAVGDQPYVYNGGQGTARFAIVSPALLVTGIDVKKFSGSNPKLPSYPRAAP
jgi:predicted Zn-dependent protease